MDTIRSFKGYGKVNEAEDREFRRKTRRRLLIIAISSVLLLLLLVAAVIGVVVTRHNTTNPTPSTPPATISQSIKALCDVTLHPDSCFSSMSDAATAHHFTGKDPEQLFKLSLQIAAGGLEMVRSLPEKLTAGVKDKRVKQLVDICTELIDDSIERLNDSMDLLRPVAGEKLLDKSKINDLNTWLSGVLTNQETCLDGFEGVDGGFREKLESAFRNSTEFISNSLAIAVKVLGVLQSVNIPIHRKLLGADTWPGWVDAHRRRLLQGSSAPALTPNVIVAKDGSGQFTTITEALALVPAKNAKAFVIHVKAGKYVENVVVDKKKWNVVMFGDGMDKTVVSGSLNCIDGTPTYKTATFVVEGEEFTAMDMTIENTAGPEKHQAVALRVKADHVVFYRCAFDAYQDTLYPHSLRQFYRECDISGTIDFIFGNAAVVFQKCNIRPRQPMPRQSNTITAQGKTDPHQNTGIVIQDCTISAVDKLNAPTYLGRPWKMYSTTVVMGTVIGGEVDPKGWLSFNGNVPPTLFYGEYENSGTGSNTSARVTWSGYKPNLSSQEAHSFSAGPFIQASKWLRTTGVSYTP